MVWGKVKHKTLTSAGDDVDITSITAQDSIMILNHRQTDGNSTNKLQLNGNTGSNYCFQYSANGGNIGGSDGNSHWNEQHYTQGNDSFWIGFFPSSEASDEIIGLGYLAGEGSEGANNSPNMATATYKVVDTGKITRVEFFNDGSGDLGSGTNTSILGVDTPTSQDVVETGVNEMDSITNIQVNTVFEDKSTGEHHLRAKYGWFKFGDSGSIPNYRGIFTGGYNSTTIDYITIATLGNGTDFGDGGSQGKAGGAVSNGTLGIFGGDNNVLNQVTIATTANSTDFGDLTGIGGNATACADATRGVWFRGNINYITMASASNATDWGHDRSPNAGDPCAFADTTRGIVAGGEANIGGWQDINDIDYITIQTISSATDFGDLTDGKRQLSGVANDTYGFAIAGYDGSSYLSDIDYVTIQTLGNASDFGNLTQSRVAQNSACGDSTRAVLGGGNNGSDVNTIDYFTMGTSGSASDFGDLQSARTRVMSCSDYVK